MDTVADPVLRHVLRDLLTDEAVADVARSCLGDPTARLRRWSIEPVPYTFGTPTTVGALRIRGVASVGSVERTWSVFAKAIQSYRHWPHLGTLPPEAREGALASDLWRYEADVYSANLGDALPTGLRLPLIHRVADLGDDRIVMVMEDVATLEAPWDVARFRRAAELLGQAAAQLTRLDALPVNEPPGGILALFYESYLRPVLLPMLRSDQFWAHPLLAGRGDGLRADLTELADHLPVVLEYLARLPRVMMHGDASPQNLLIPADAPDTFVAIDWSLGGIAPVGDDLAQLHLGLAHAGELAGADLPPLHDVLINGYAGGLRAGGLPQSVEDIRYGMDGGLLVRSTFTALPFERFQEPLTEELDQTVQQRLALTRYLAGLGRALIERTP
jgi:hypothetical protein